MAGWLLVVGITGVLLTRYASITRPMPILIAGLTPLLAVPIVMGGLMSAASKSTVLRAAMAALTAVYLATVAPHDAIIDCGPTHHDDAIKVVASNVLGDGATSTDVAAFALETNADVLVLSEAAFWFLEDLDPLLDEQYPFQSHRLVPETNGSAIFSRWPLSDVENFPVSGVPTLGATVDSPYGPFRVVGVHTQAPIDSYTAMSWRTQFEELRTVPLEVPTVLAGDFNATEDHKPFRELLDNGWRDVHDDKGCGLDNTWPTARPQQSAQRTIPILRLDHVLVTDHFKTLSVDVRELQGSDHAAVETDVVLIS